MRLKNTQFSCDNCDKDFATMIKDCNTYYDLDNGKHFVNNGVQIYYLIESGICKHFKVCNLSNEILIERIYD